MPRSSIAVTAVLSLGLTLGQVSIMTVPAVSVELAAVWALDATEVGWLGGVYFTGYAAGLPFLSGAAGRLDGRYVYATSAAISAAASLGFAIAADGFWSAFALRFLAGVGFAGFHVVGMKLLVDRLAGEAQARAGAFYSAAYAIGSGASFLIAGEIAATFDWRSAFTAAGIAALLALPIPLFVGSPQDGAELRSPRLLPDFALALRDPEIRRYVLAYAGNTWEVFATRVWFVPFLAFNAGLYGGEVPGGWHPATLAGLSAIAAVPVSLLVAELGVRLGRRRVILGTSVASVLVCGLIGWQATAPYILIVALLFLHGATSYGDAGAINGGIMRASRPETRAAALALFGLAGFVSGFGGSLAVGAAVDAAGGREDATAWLAAFLVLALGSVATALAVGGRQEMNLPSRRAVPDDR